MNHATISADIISYTSLSATGKRRIGEEVDNLLVSLSQKYGAEQFWGRVVKGDYIEMVMQSPAMALRAALLLKTRIKSLDLVQNSMRNIRLKYFREHGVRLAVAVAPLSTIDRKNGIIDGEAIYLSGRAIKDFSTSGKQKIVIKNTLFFRSPNSDEQEKYETLFSLLDTIIARCSAKQCEVVFYKLMELSEKEISEKLGRNQSTISQHSTAAGWQAIEKSVLYFEKYIT